jgi:hypothetical protein
MTISIDASELIERLTATIGRLTVEVETKDAALEKAQRLIFDMEKALQSKVTEQLDPTDVD